MSHLKEITGTLFSSPENSVLVHACNCQGVWGRGVARGFKELYPHAFNVYRAHCKTYLASPPVFTTLSPTTTNTTSTSDYQVRRPEGECLVIKPQNGDAPRSHWIACLFTRWDYRGKGDVERVLDATGCAVGDLERQLGALRLGLGLGGGGGGTQQVGYGKVGEVFTCRINEGCFGVPWERTRKVLEEEGVRWTVVRLREDVEALETEGAKRWTRGVGEVETCALEEEEEEAVGRYVGLEASGLRKVLKERGLCVQAGWSSQDMVGLLVDDDEGPPRARYLRLSRDELETEVGLRGLSAVGDERCGAESRRWALVCVLHRDDLENGVENVPKMPEVARAKDGTMDETKDEGLPSQVATRPLETTANDREDEERFFSDFTRQLLEASRAHPEKEEIFYSGGTSVQLRAPKDEHQKMDNENGAEARRLKRTRLI